MNYRIIDRCQKHVIAIAQAEVKFVSDQLAELPADAYSEKAELMWALANVRLRDLESVRPAGGWKS